MARHKDQDWNLADDINDNGNAIGLARRQVAILMDLRDELKRMNTILHCHNFLAIPSMLRSINRKTPMPRKAKKAKAA